MGRVAAGALVTLAGLVAAGPATASDAELVRAGADLMPSVELAAGRASGRDPQSVQAAYDLARDLQEAVRGAAPVSGGCRPLARALGAYAAARVRQQEAVDRFSPSEEAGAARGASRARNAAGATAAGCPGTGGGRSRPSPPISPTDGEAFFGVVVARAPGGARAAVLEADGLDLVRATVRGGRAHIALAGPAGRHTFRVAFTAAGRTLATRTVRGAWLLPPSARTARPGLRADPALDRRLAAALAAGPRFRAAWVQDLRTGTSAQVNAGARFPAASTVKLGVMAGALGRLGPAPERTTSAYDLAALARWSSNLAANRLVARLGGVGLAADGLRRLGAGDSTYPGDYLVGTELQPGLPSASAAASPPPVSGRVTTARDLARMLYALHATAAGDRAARRETGLTVHQARMALGWLLDSEQRGGNRSLVAPGAPPGTPVAQKNGWLNDARHAAAIVYAPDGPRIVTLMTYDDRGVGLEAARELGARVARAALAG